MITNHNKERWHKRKVRVRKRIHGTEERPRLTVFRTARHIYAQVVDDDKGITLACASTLDKQLANELEKLKKAEAAEKVGALVAERCKAKSIGKVVFDRNGFPYTGRIAKMADAARKGGLSF